MCGALRCVTLPVLCTGSIYTFNVGMGADSREAATEAGVRIVATNIIYRLVEQLRQEVAQHMSPLHQETVLGNCQDMPPLNQETVLGNCQDMPPLY